MRGRAPIFIAIPVLIAVVAAIGIFAVSRQARPSTAYALVDQSTLMVLSGQISITRADNSKITATRAADVPVRVGDQLDSGTDGRGVVTFFDGSTTEIEPGTIITLQKMDKLPGGGVNISMNQQIGQTWNRVEKLVDANSRFETTTASSVAYVRGTGYKITVDSAQKTTLEVYEGSVYFEAAGVTVVVPAGYFSTAVPGQPPTEPQPIPPSQFGLRIQVDGPARAYVTDNFNRSVGFQPEVNAFGSQIPATSYTVGGNTHTLDVSEPVNSYTIVLTPDGDGGNYVLTVTGLVNGQPVAYRSVGLARTLDAEQLSGPLLKGQHLQTGFDYANGQIQNFQRPGTLVDAFPGRMLLVSGQQGNGAREDQIAAGGGTGATGSQGGGPTPPSGTTPVVVALAQASATPIPPTEAATQAPQTPGATNTPGIATSTGVPTAVQSTVVQPAPTEVVILAPTVVPPEPTELVPTETIEPTATATLEPATATPTSTFAPLADTPLPTVQSVPTEPLLALVPPAATPTLVLPFRIPQGPPPVLVPGARGAVPPPGLPPLGPVSAGSAPPMGPIAQPTVILSTHGGFLPNGVPSPTLPILVTSTPTSGPSQAINPFQATTINGNYVAAGVGLRNSTSGTINLAGIPSGATIRQAYLYWGLLGNVEDPSFRSLSFQGHALTGSLIGTGLDTCWGLNGSFAYRSDVTSLVPGNGSYTLTNVANGANMLRDGATLLVIYDSNDIQRALLLYDGDFVVQDAVTSFNIHLTGFNAQPLEAGGISAKTTFIIGDGQTFTENLSFTAPHGSLSLNNTVDGSDGDFWDTDSYDVSTLFASGDTFADAMMGPGDQDCLMWVAQVMSISGTASNTTPTPTPSPSPTRPSGTADVAIVQNIGTSEITALTNYLTEMGLTSHVFNKGDLTPSSVQQFRLIIWDDESFAIGGITDNDVTVFQAAFNAGIPLYFIGDDLAAATSSGNLPTTAGQWTSMIHLNPASSNFGGNGTVTIVNASHPVTNGPFGQVHDFDYGLDIDTTTETNTGELLLGQSGGTPVLLAVDQGSLAAQVELGERTVTQNVLAFTGSSPAGVGEKHTLFKNAVAWLLQLPQPTPVPTQQAGATATSTQVVVSTSTATFPPTSTLTSTRTPTGTIGATPTPTLTQTPPLGPTATLTATPATGCRGATCTPTPVPCSIFTVTCTPTPSPTVSVTPGPASVVCPLNASSGSTVTCTGSGFDPNESVTVNWVNGPSNTQHTVIADGNGHLQDSLSNVQPGIYTVTMHGQSSGRSGSTGFQVT